MKATDVIKLSLAGKTPGEIRELMELESELKAAEKEEQAPTKLFEMIKEQPKEEPKAEEPKAEKPKAEEPKEEPKEPEPDYKKLYEDSQKELKAAQAANAKKDMSGDDPIKERQKIIEDLVRSYM